MLARHGFTPLVLCIDFILDFNMLLLKHIVYQLYQRADIFLKDGVLECQQVLSQLLMITI
jgi:hypothetical protein